MQFEMNKIKKFFGKKVVLAVSLCLLLVVIIAEAVFIFYNYEKKRELSGASYKIGLIQDFHSQRSKKNNYDVSDDLKEFFRYANGQFNNKFHPDVVVQNGDLILGTEREGQQSIDDFLKIKSYIDKVEAPILHVMGNHEARGFSKEDWLKITAYNKTYYSYDVEKMRVIILDGNEETEEARTIGGNFYYMSKEQLNWLEKALSESEGFRYKLAFVHFPVLESQIVPTDKNINSEDIKKMNKLFRKYNVNAVFSGHAEILRYEESEGIKYFILPGIEKSKRRKVQWFDCFYEIYVGKDIRVKMFYKKDHNQKEYKTLEIPSEEFDKIEK